MSDDITDTHADTAEPSMEDILASIRRIIADDDVADASTAVDSGADFLSVIEDDKAEEFVDTADIEKADVVPHETVEALEELSTEDTDLPLSDLELDEIVEPLELDVESEVTSIEDMDEPDDVTPKGFAAMAAAGLGGVAASGAAIAKKLKDTRVNPVPSAADEDIGEEALDLLLDDVSLHEEGGLESVLEIPDSEETAPIDDIEALLGNILPETDEDAALTADISEDEFFDDSVFDPGEALLVDDEDMTEQDLTDNMISDMLGDNEHDIAASSQTDEDLDLVKSLMADLTDDPYTNFDEEEAHFAEEDADSDSEADLVDDILSLSMDDEVSLQQAADNEAIEAMLADSGAAVLDDSDVADILAPVVDSAEPALEDSDPFIISMSEDLSARPAPAAERSRLSAIADMAMKDADRIERSTGSATAFAAGAGVMIATAGPLAAALGRSQGDEEPELLSAAEEPNLQEAEDIFEGINPSAGEASQGDELETPDTEIHERQNLTPTEETADMPKAAANKDTIIDVVTEEASASAFASLNSVVEEKAIMADRGDRIGDLVQEALRPMLKEWLDKNLKGIVERAVTKEVKRISSGK